MKSLVATIIGLAVAVFANPAAAYVVEVTTSISIASVGHRSTLHNLPARQFVVRPDGNGPASIVEVAARP